MSAVPAEIKLCSVCGTPFECGARRESCWCQTLPPLSADQLVTNVDCRCPACLAESVREAESAQPAQSGA